MPCEPEVARLVRQRRGVQPLRPNCPLVEPEYATNAMIDGRRPVRAAGVGARLRHHAVPIGHEVDRVGALPRDVVLLERLEPVVQDLGVGPPRVVGMGALDRVFMQEGDRRFDQLPVSGEQKRESGGPRLAHGDSARLFGSVARSRGHFIWGRQRGLADDLHHEALPCGSEA